MPGPAWLKTSGDVAPPPETDASVIPVGPDGQLAAAVLETVASAEEVLIVASFLLAWKDLQSRLRAASERGVRIYVLTASEKRLRRRLRSDDDFEQGRIEEHLELLDDLAKHALVRTAPGFHAKVVLADPATACHGWLLTANLAHAPVTLSDELGIALTKSEARSVFQVLRHAWWEMAEHEVSVGALQSVRPAGLVPPPPPIAAVSSLQPSGLIEELIGAIESSEEVLLTNYSWSADHPITRCVMDAVAGGTQVTVISRAAKETAWAGDTLAEMAARGVRVLGTDRMHAKVLMSDTAVLVHTMNYGMVPDGSGLEIGLGLKGKRAQSVRRIAEHWVSTAPWRLDPSGAALPGEDLLVPISGSKWSAKNVAQTRQGSS